MSLTTTPLPLSTPPAATARNPMESKVSVATYVNTIRHFRREQIYGLYLARYPRRIKAANIAVDIRPLTGTWQRPIEAPAVQTGPATFRLATGDRDVLSAAGWSDADTPRLWLYNLHYFDDLIAVGADSRRAWHVELIARWMAENPPGTGIGWEPYPTACRIVNWIKWAIASGSLSPQAANSLALQACHLQRNLEWRLLGNHLFADLKALILAGCFFQGSQADEWLRAGLRLAEKQIAEQVLADGGHCEQSPMYHAIVLGDLLDMANAAAAYPGRVPSVTRQFWIQTCSSMLQWLDTMCHPDGLTSFFSDGGFASYDPSALRDYAVRLAVPVPAGTTQPLIHLRESGYVRLQNANIVVLFDVGEIGPVYQPGHGHADALSIELSHKGRRILVNPGTSTYTEGSERYWQRSTAAHNTVEVDGKDQSELWGAFRVARRAHPLEVRTTKENDIVRAEGAHDGYRRLRPAVVHHRSVELAGNSVVVRDTLSGRGNHKANIWFHFHPEVSLCATPDAIVVEYPEGSMQLRLDRQLASSIEKSSYNPRFGVSQKSRAVVGSWSGTCPVTFTSRLEFA